MNDHINIILLSSIFYTPLLFLFNNNPAMFLYFALSYVSLLAYEYEFSLINAFKLTTVPDPMHR